MAEYCPFCKAPREMRATQTEQVVPSSKQRVRTRSFHCEICHRFIRSEDRPLAGTPK